VNKYNNSSTSNNNDNSNTSFSYDINAQNNNQQDFTDSINRSLDQTKDNINKSIEESRNQIPRYNDIVNNYQEQALQATREISESFIESQKTIINSIQSAWRPYQQNFNTTVNNSWNSPQAIANTYSRFVSIVADNSISALRTTNNIIFSNFDSWKSVLQQAKENSKQLFNQNVNVAKIFEQNSREIATAAQEASSKFNDSINSSSVNGSSTNTTNTGSNNTTGTASTSTTTSSTSAA
jgi:hypothetical protein